jgi:small subunit ribosomal protein S18
MDNNHSENRSQGGGGFREGGREGREGGGREGRESRGGGRGFGRRKVCPFILDKTLLLDYKNIKMVQRFITETGRIVPRHISGVCAKNQRRLTKQIKRARNLGLIAPKTEG